MNPPVVYVATALGPGTDAQVNGEVTLPSDLVFRVRDASGVVVWTWSGAIPRSGECSFFWPGIAIRDDNFKAILAPPGWYTLEIEASSSYVTFAQTVTHVVRVEW